MSWWETYVVPMVSDVAAPFYNSLIPKPVYNRAGVHVGNFYDSPLYPDVFAQACQGNLAFLSSASSADIGSISDLQTTDSQGHWIPLCSYCHSRGVACLEVVRNGQSPDGYQTVMATLPDGTQVATNKVVPISGGKNTGLALALMGGAVLFLALSRRN